MNGRTEKTLTAFVALALSVLLVPGALEAQEEQETPERQDECTVSVTPQSVQTGEAAVSVTARLSESVGTIEDFEAPEESGLELADPSDIQKRTMALEEGEEGEQEDPEPIQTARDEKSEVTLWLNTQEAEPGSYEVTLKGTSGDCKGDVSVGQKSESPDSDG